MDNFALTSKSLPFSFAGGLKGIGLSTGSTLTILLGGVGCACGLLLLASTSVHCRAKLVKSDGNIIKVLLYYSQRQFPLTFATFLTPKPQDYQQLI